MNENFEFRAAGWEAGDAETIIGYAVVFEQRTVLYKDPETGIEYGEIIDRHALDKADLDDVVLRYNHTGRPLARTRNKSLKLSIDGHGLRIEADLSGSSEGRSFYQDVKSGLLDKMSFAFQVQEETRERSTNTRRILAISRLQDVSLVDFPAYDQTQVSARSRFEAMAEPDRKAFRTAQVRNVHAEMRNRIAALHIPGEAADYRSRAEMERQSNGYPPELPPRPDEVEALRHDILELRSKLDQAASSDNLDSALELRANLDELEQQLKTAISKRQAIRAKVAAGGGIPWRGIQNTNKKEINSMSTESREFFNKIIETRAAGSTSTMTAVIPAGVMNQYVVEKAPGAFLAAAKITAITHNGNLTLPIAALQPITPHTENAEIADAGYVPGSITIEHHEYCYQTGYSDLGMKIGAENLERIVRDTILASMFKKMDGICIDAAAALTYTKNSNAVEIASGSAPTYAEFVQLAGYLGSDFLEGAKWYMHPSTYFTWLMGLKDSQARPILDASKLVSEQAFCGYGIDLDSQIPAKVVYFGDAGRVHLNYAREPELNAWTDYDHNTQKLSVRAVAGASAETGCMVKMYHAS